MKFKRLMALALAGVMTLAMAGSAMAEEAKDESKPLKDATIITKEIDFADGVKLPAKTLSFAFTQTAGPGSADNYTKVDLAPTIELTEGSVTKQYTQVIDSTKFTTPGEYVYTITENKDNDSAWNYNTENVSYELHVYKKAAASGGDVTYLIKNSDGSKAYTALFKNEYKPLIPEKDGASLKVTKDVTGSEEYSLTKDYTFKVKITYADKIATAGGKYYVGKEIPQSDESWTPVPANGEIETDIQKGLSIFFKELPQGIKYTITEDETINTLGANFQGCTISDQQTTKDPAKAAVADYTDAQTAARAVVFTNEFQGITPTGLAISVAPFVAMFAAVGAAIALYVAAKRRVR